MHKDQSEKVAVATATLLGELKRLQVRGVLKEMVQRGQLIDLRCEMPKCYCPRGRGFFDPREQSPNDWSLSVDHYPRLRTDGGHRIASNVRIGHVLCNREDYGWRRRIASLLDKGKSLVEIADDLNRKGIQIPHGHGSWTPKLVRKAFVS